MRTFEMIDLKDGDQVVYTGTNISDSWPATGTIITRKKCWMDCNLSSLFTWTDHNGEDEHFFIAHDIDFIKE